MYRWSSCRAHSRVLHVEALEDRCVPSTTEYVTGLYNVLLHRNPAPAEVAGWVDALHTGAVSAAEVAQAFATCAEYAADAIRADYNVFLGRQPAPAEVVGWIAPWEAAGEKQIEASFLASEEFFSRQGGNASDWLNGVYQDALGRAPDSAGQRTWLQTLQAGAPRAAVALAIVDSPEALGRFVSAAYLNLLERTADPSGLAAWVAQLQHGLPPSGMVAGFASSQEFIRLKAHGVLDPSCTPSAPVSNPAPAEAEPSVEVATIVPCSPDTVTTADPGSACGAVSDPGSDGSACASISDSSTFDPGSDSSGCDPSFDDSGADAGDEGSGDGSALM